MARYALIIEQKKHGVEDDKKWWLLLSNVKSNLLIFDSFEDAKIAMRNKVKEICSSKDIPFNNGKYEPLEKFMSDIDYDYEEDEYELKRFSEILSNTVFNVDYSLDDPDLDVEYDDSGDWYFAFIGNSERLLVDYYDKILETNVHDMSDDTKLYWLTYKQYDDYEKSDLSSEITITLYKEDE